MTDKWNRVQNVESVLTELTTAINNKNREELNVIGGVFQRELPYYKESHILKVEYKEKEDDFFIWHLNEPLIKLDWTTNPFHKSNPKHLSLNIEDLETIKSYVLDFVGFMRASEKHFIIVQSEEDMKLFQSNKKKFDSYSDKWLEMIELVTPMTLVENNSEEENKVNFSVSMIFDNTLFSAIINVDLENGTIDMSEDEPVLDDLPGKFEMTHKGFKPVVGELYSQVLELAGVGLVQNLESLDKEAIVVLESRTADLTKFRIINYGTQSPERGMVLTYETDTNGFLMSDKYALEESLTLAAMTEDRGNDVDLVNKLERIANDCFTF